MWWLLVASVGGAPADHIELTWDAPAGCPTAQSVIAETDRLLAGASVAGTVRATVSVSQRDGAFQAEFSMESDGGRTDKRLVGQRCETIANAVALEVALVLNLDSALATLAEDAKQPPEPPPPAAVPPAATRPSQPRELAIAKRSVPARRKPRVSGGLRATGGAALGQTATATGGVGLAAAAVFRGVRVEATGWMLVPASQPVEDSGSVDVMLGSAGLRACPVPRLGPVEMPLCIGFEGGAVRAQARRLPQTDVVHEPWAGFSVAPALATKIFGALHLWVEGAAVLNLVRPGFHVQGAGSVYRMPMGSARVLAGFEMRFGSGQ